MCFLYWEESFKCISYESSTLYVSEYEATIIFLTNVADYIEMILSESLCLYIFSHGALGTACASEGMWVRQ